MKTFRVYVMKLVRFDGYIDVVAQSDKEAFNSVAYKIEFKRIKPHDIKNWKEKENDPDLFFDVTEDVFEQREHVYAQEVEFDTKKFDKPAYKHLIKENK